MKLSHSAMVLASLAASAVLGAACSFPKIDFWTESESAGGGGPTEASSSSVGAGGGGEEGGETAASSSSADGGASSSAGGGGSGGASSSASSSSGGIPCPIDADQDGAISKQCPGGTDCADHDFLAHPEPPAVGVQAGPIQGATAPGTQPFDFNCDGSEVGETLVLSCEGLTDCTSGLGFASAVACGQAGALGHCASLLGLGCKWKAENPPKNKVQRCK